MIEIFTICYNEEIILQKFIEHYRTRFPNCEITIYDNMSTDNSRQIAIKNGCKVLEYDSNNEIRDDLYLEIKNNCWKQAKTDWVLICDTDEFLNINQEQLEKEDCSIILSKGYNMVNLEDDLIFDNIKFGIRAKQYDKYYLFNKSKIKEINYEAGCHSANPKGEIKFSKNVYNLFHYTMLSEQYLINRYRRSFERLSKENKKHGWGIHYKESEQTIRDKFTTAKKWFSENREFNLEQAINIKMIKHNYQKIAKTGYWNGETAHIHHVHCKELSKWICKFLNERVSNYEPIRDMGCGLGNYLKDLQEFGFTNLAGFEADPPKHKVFNNILKQDLTIPFTFSPKGVVISLECGEHISKKYMNEYLDNITNNCSNYLIMSWAIRGQAGFGHVNCLDNHEIIPLIESRGFKLMKEETEEVRNINLSEAPWFKNTLLIFKKNK